VVSHNPRVGTSPRRPGPRRAGRCHAVTAA
jgi:hypothetical protein